MSEVEVHPEEIKPEEKKDETKIPASLIAIDQHGRVMAKNNQELLRYCGALIHGNGVPKRFDTPTKLFAALMFVRDLKLPDTAIRYVAEIHGNMCAFGDLPLSLSQRDGEMTFLKEQWFDKNYNIICFENKNLDEKVYGSVCLMERKDMGGVQSFSFTMKDAEDADLYPAKKRDGSLSPNSPWMKYTKIMLRYKARTIGLKSLFADKVNGLSIAEYDYGVLGDVNMDNIKDVSESNTELKNEINNSTLE